MSFITNLELVKMIRRGKGIVFTHESHSIDNSKSTIFFDADQIKENNFLTEAIDAIENTVEFLNSKEKEIAVAISCHIKKVFSKDEIKKINELNKIVYEKTGRQIAFYESDTFWSLEEVKKANGSIENLVDKIKKLESEKNFSPLEQFLFAYNEISKRKYIKEEKNEHYSVSRSIYSVLNQEKIVCVGYSSILKEVCNQLGGENIKCFTNVVSTEENDGTLGGHANNLVYIKDEKYGVDGFYYADSCWDCFKEEDNQSTFSLALVPLSDVDHIKSSKLSTDIYRSVIQGLYDISFSGHKNKLLVSDKTIEEIEKITGQKFDSDNPQYENIKNKMLLEKEKIKEVQDMSVANEIMSLVNESSLDYKSHLSHSIIIEEFKNYLKDDQYNNFKYLLNKRINLEMKKTDSEYYVSITEYLKEKWKVLAKKISGSELRSKNEIFFSLLDSIPYEYYSLKNINPHKIENNRFYNFIKSFEDSMFNIAIGIIDENNKDYETKKLKEIFENVNSNNYYKFDNIKSLLDKIVEDYLNQDVSEKDIKVGFIKHYAFDKSKKISSKKMINAIKKVLDEDGNKNFNSVIRNSTYHFKNTFDREKTSSWLSKPVAVFIQDMFNSMHEKNNDFVDDCCRLYNSFLKNNEVFDDNFEKELENLYVKYVKIVDDYSNKLNNSSISNKEKVKFYQEVQFAFERFESYGVVNTSKIDKKLMNKILSYNDNNIYYKLKRSIEKTTNYLNESFYILNEVPKSYIFVRNEDFNSLNKIMNVLETKDDLFYQEMNCLYDIYNRIVKQMQVEYVYYLCEAEDNIKKMAVIEFFDNKINNFENSIIGDFDKEEFENMRSILNQDLINISKEINYQCFNLMKNSFSQPLEDDQQ